MPEIWLSVNTNIQVIDMIRLLALVYSEMIRLVLAITALLTVADNGE